jgi:hypothetical protein
MQVIELLFINKKQKQRNLKLKIYLHGITKNVLVSNILYITLRIQIYRIK